MRIGGGTGYVQGGCKCQKNNCIQDTTHPTVHHTEIREKPMTSCTSHPLTLSDLSRGMLAELASFRSVGTSVVTVCLKPTADVPDLIARMKAEAVTAANIKCRL